MQRPPLVANPEGPQRHSVLAQLSLGYSQLEGRLSTRYSPVCHCTHPLAGTFPFDLHVLCTPRAFILSQDQTLQFKFDAPRRGERQSLEPENGFVRSHGFARSQKNCRLARTSWHALFGFQRPARYYHIRSPLGSHGSDSSLQEPGIASLPQMRRLTGCRSPVFGRAIPNYTDPQNRCQQEKSL